MTLEQWVVLSASGAMFGLIGQLIWTIMGLHKRHQAKGEASADPPSSLHRPQLVSTLPSGECCGWVCRW